MDAMEKFIAGAFALIALYLIFNAPNLSGSIRSIAVGFSQIFGTLQGRDQSQLPTFA